MKFCYTFSDLRSISSSRFHHHLLQLPIIRRMFAAIPQRDSPHNFNALLAKHVRKNDTASSLLLFKRLRSHGVALDAYTFTLLLSSCAASQLGSIFLGQLHSLMIKTGCSMGIISSTSLLHVYSKCGHVDDAVRVFYEMPVKDAVAWNAVLSCYSRHGFDREVFLGFRAMLNDEVEFTGFTLCTLLGACASSGDLILGRQIHSLVVVAGYDSVVLSTALIDLYSRCRKIEDALEVFSRLKCQKDAAVYNAVIGGCMQNQLYTKAFGFLRGLEPDETTLTLALSACSETLKLSYGKQIHCVLIMRKFSHDTISCNALIDMYAKCGDIRSALSVFKRIVKKDVVSWTTMIDAYGCHGHGIEALELFKMMEQVDNNVTPNEITFLSVLSACAHSGLIDEGKECFFSMTKKYGLSPASEHYACLIDLLGRAGRIFEAWELFCEVRENPSKLTNGVCVAMLEACKISMDLKKGEHVAELILDLDPNNTGSYVLLSNFYAAIGNWKRVEDIRKLMRDTGLEKELGNSHLPISASCAAL